MPTLPDVDQVFKIVVEGTNQGQNWANVFHAQWEGTSPSSVDCISIAEDVWDAYAADFLPVIQENAVLQQVTVTDLTTTSGSVGGWTASQAGGDTGPTLTAGASIVVSWRIARRYRGGKPRTYLPPPSQDEIVDTSHYKDTYVADVLAAAVAFRNDVNGITSTDISGLELGCVSYYDKASVPTPPHLRATPLFEPFTDISVNTRIDSQRRRLGR